MNRRVDKQPMPPPDGPVGRLSAAQIDLALSLSEVGTWCFDLQAGIAVYDQRGCDLLGHDFNAAHLQDVRHHVHPDDLPRLQAAFAQCLATGGPVDTETRYRRGDGEWRNLLTRRVLQRSADGEPRVMLGVVIDVTEQRRTLEQLRVAHERTTLALAGAGMGTWVLDAADGQVHGDTRLAALRGVPAPAQWADWQAYVAAVHPDDRPAASALLTAGLHSVESLAHEYRVQRCDGQWRRLAMRSSALLDEQGLVVKRLGVEWDVTDARLAEEARRAHDIALHEGRAKAISLARISHELRTPLNAILGFTRLLQDEVGRLDRATLRHRLGQIQGAGEHLLSLVDDVLQLTGGQSGHATVVREPTPLGDVFERAGTLVTAAAQAHNIKIVWPDHTPTVLGDPQRLVQVLINLIGNSIKYNFDGGHVQVHCLQSADGDHVQIEVQDSGRGIDPHRARELFEPFNRLDAASSIVPGHGLGLAITKTYVEAMGGRLWLAHTSNVGCTFAFTLPRWSEPQLQGKQPAARPSVLYIEDNAVNMLLLSETVRLHGAAVFHEAYDAASGVHLARLLRPDLVFIDMHLPDGDGIDVLRQLRAHPTTAGLRCIALSADATAASAAAAMAAGFEAYWTKPLETELLHATLDRLRSAAPTLP